MKTAKITFIAVILSVLLLVQLSYSQSNVIKKTSTSHLRGPKKISHEKISATINKNIKSFKRDLSGSWVLDENFESGIFPPVGWSITFGAEEWQQAFVSGYGNGDYSMFYSSWNCNFSNNVIFSDEFTSPTVTGDKLLFDYAYAPWTDGSNVYYDELEIFYYDSDQSDWFSLVYYTGDSIQTSPATPNYFVPLDNEWGTKIIDIPESATSIYFQPYENCSNNMYIDNIRVGTLSTSYDASVENVWAKGKLPLVFGVPDTVRALIKNVGGTPVTNLKVYLNIAGTDNFIDSLEIGVMNPGDTVQVDFRGFSPVLNGFSTVTVSIPPDDDNGNNSGTYIAQTNPNTFRYVDSNCCNSAVGWVGELSFVNKYSMSGTGQIRRVNVKLGGGNDNIGQIVYGIVLDANGVIVGKSSHYKVLSTDLDKYVAFDITDPKPFITTNSYYYVGIAQTQFSGDGFAYGIQQLNADAPARPNANYGTYLGPVGSTVFTFEFPREYGQNYAIESVAGTQAAIDAGVSDLGLTYEQYFSTTTFTPVGKVFNAGTGSATFTVNRKITPGAYTSTKTVTGLTAGSNANVTFDPWTFIAGTNYTVRDSVVLAGDGNTSNNVLSRPVTPRIAKQLCVLWQQQQDRDSIVRSILADGRYANNFDTVRINYTGSYRPWKIMFVNFKEEGSYMPWVRDSMKSFIDNSTAGNKKSLIVFADNIGINNDPNFYYNSPADTIFYRQYLKAMTLSDDWMGSIPASQKKFRGIGFFDGITQDSVSDPYTPELIKPVNGSTAAFKPRSVTGNNNDSCIAVSFAGTNCNTFFVTNLFSSFRASSNSLRGPVLVYTKIIDWIQSVNTGVKVLDLTLLIEGFYDVPGNIMVGDTVRVYLRNSSNPFAIVDSAKGYLNASGIGSFIFNNASNGINYYFHIKHRNGIETWSKTPQMFSSNHLAYNFTTAANKAFGDNLKQAGSKWVIYGGDPNQDGTVDAGDIIIVFNDVANFVSGYVKTDLNGDDFVDVGDLLLAYNNSSQFVTKITPLTSPEILAKKKIVVEQFDPGIQVILENENKVDHEIYEKYKNKIENRNFKPSFESYKVNQDRWFNKIER